MTCLTFSSIAPWLLHAYMQDLSAEALPNEADAHEAGRYRLRGAEVHFRALPPLHVGSMVLSQLELCVQAEDSSLEADVTALLKLKAIRGGG